MPKPDAALFDMDGLLLDSERLSLASFHESCAHFELGDKSEVFYRVIGSNTQALIAILDDSMGEQISASKFHSDWFERYNHLTHREPVPLKTGIVELLDWLKAQQIRCAVATSSTTTMAQSKLSHAGIIEYFEMIVGGDQVEKSKPDPEIYLKASALIGADPKKSIGLEDSNNGVRSAVAAGLNVVQVPDLVQPSAELKALGHTICGDMLEVLALMKSQAMQWGS